MTTPSINNPYSIISGGLLEAGLVPRGNEPDGELLAECMERLRDMINLWQTQGIKLFLQQDLPITLVSGQQMYSCKPSGDVNMTKPLRALQGYYLDSNSIRRPLTLLSRDEWMRLGNVTNTGAVNSFFVDKLAAELDVYMWLIPDATAATGTVHLLFQTQVTNPVNLTEDMAFPPEWKLALLWGIADEKCGGQPQAIMERCASRAKMYREALEDWDVEDASTYLVADQRSGVLGRFR